MITIQDQLRDTEDKLREKSADNKCLQVQLQSLKLEQRESSQRMFNELASLLTKSSAHDHTATTPLIVDPAKPACQISKNLNVHFGESIEIIIVTNQSHWEPLKTSVCDNCIPRQLIISLTPIVNFSISFLSWNGRALMPNIALKDYDFPKFPVIFAYNSDGCSGIYLILMQRKYISYEEGKKVLIKADENGLDNFDSRSPICGCISCSARVKGESEILYPDPNKFHRYPTLVTRPVAEPCPNPNPPYAPHQFPPYNGPTNVLLHPVLEKREKQLNKNK